MIQYKSYAESARELRKALKARWPGVTFSVTKSGRNCADVRWVDGPTWEQVKRFVAPFEGADFDPMQDLETPRGNGSGIKYIFPCRDFSETFLIDTLAAMKKEWGFDPMPVLERSTRGGCWINFNAMIPPNMPEVDWPTVRNKMHWAERFLQDREG